MEPEREDDASRERFTHLYRLAERLLEGERVDIDEVCRQYPEDADRIRAIAQDAWALAEESNGPSDSEVPSSDEVTVRTATHAHRGSFDRYLEILRTCFGPARYRWLKKHGRGGMGAIHIVEDTILRRRLAKKVILGQGDSNRTSEKHTVDDRTLGRFLDEASVMAQLDHPGIVPVHELGVDPSGSPYFTMKLVKGDTYATIIDKVHRGADDWTITRAIQVLLRVAEALSYAHLKNVIHRDLKPANIMVGRFGEVYLMDWGLARVLGEEDQHDLRICAEGRPDSITRVSTPRRRHAGEDRDSPIITMGGDLLGTPNYMSPEQALGILDQVGVRSDIYSFGAVLYHLLAGHAPYASSANNLRALELVNQVIAGPPDSLSKIATRQPAVLRAICEKAMSRSMEQRYQSMPDLERDLRGFLDGGVVSAYRVPISDALRQWVNNNRRVVFASSVFAILFVITVAEFVIKLSTKNSELSGTKNSLELSEHILAIRLAASNIDAGRGATALTELNQSNGSTRDWEWNYWVTEANHTRFMSRDETGIDVIACARPRLEYGERGEQPIGTIALVRSGPGTYRVEQFDGEANSTSSRALDLTCWGPGQFSGDGSLLLLALDDNVVVLDALTHQIRFDLQSVLQRKLPSDTHTTPTSSVVSCAFHSDNDQFVMILGDGTSAIASTRTQEVELGPTLSLSIDSSREPSDYVIVPCRNPDRALVASSRSAHLVDFRSKEILSSISFTEPLKQPTLYPIKNTNYYIAYSVDTAFVLEDVGDKLFLEKAPSLSGQQPLCAVHTATLAYNRRANKLSLISIWRQGQVIISQFTNPDDSPVTAASFDGRSSTISYMTARGRNYVTSIATCDSPIPLLATVPNGDRRPDDLAFLENGELRLVYWENRVRPMRSPSDDILRVVARSSLGTEIWSIETIGVFAADEQRELAVSSDGSRLVIASKSGKIATYDTRRAQLDQVKQLHLGEVTAVTFDPAADKIAVCAGSKSIVLNRKTLEIERELDTGFARCRAISLSRNAEVIAALEQRLSQDGTDPTRYWVWQASTDTSEIRAADAYDATLILTPRGRRVILGANPTQGRAARVIDCATGRIICELPGSNPLRLRWSESGNTLLATGDLVQAWPGTRADLERTHPARLRTWPMSIIRKFPALLRWFDSIRGR